MTSSSDILHGKILIVDDLEANVLLLEQMLRRGGYDCISVTVDSEMVCELHLRNHYDLILLDLQMPGMDGFQVMENLKQIETSGYLPVLVITAQPDHKLKALQAGAKDFISKPFDLAEVLIRVHNMLEVRLLHKETRELCDRVAAEQKVSERLLHGLLPPVVAERLTEHRDIPAGSPTDLIAESAAEVTVLFADVAAFTAFSEGLSAKVLMGVLDDLSTRFAGFLGNRGLERRNVIGDAYLAAVGLPDPLAERTIQGAHMALDLIEAVDRFNAHSPYQLRVRIGVSTSAGPGVVSDKRSAHYDL